MPNEKNPKEKNPLNRIILWKGIIAKPAFQEEHADVLRRLNDGETKGLSFKKLKTRHPLLNGTYSIRDKKDKYGDRLLVRLIEIDGKLYPLILEKVKRHKHREALYLNDTAGMVGRYQKLLDSIEDIDFIKDDGTAFLPPATPAPKKPTSNLGNRITYYKNEFVALTDEQDMALHAPLPSLLIGDPGYGKTAVASEALRFWMDEFLETPPLKSVTLVYVAEQEKLVNEFRKQYKEHPLSTIKAQRVRIKFMTLKDFARANQIAGTPLKIVEGKQFLLWFSNYREKWLNQEKAQSRSEAREMVTHPEIFDNPELVYKELKHGIVLKEKDYLKSGLKGTKSRFTDNARALLWQIGEAYIESLNENQECDLALNPPAMKKAKYFKMIVDESEILSPSVITLLEEASINKNVLWIYGSGQSLNLCNLHYFTTRNIPSITLSKSLRTPMIIADLSINCSYMAEATAGSLVKPLYQSKPMQPNPQKKGRAYWVTIDEVPPSMKANPLLTIIARREDVARAKLFFNTELVFTPEQMQGCDGEFIVIFDGLNDPIFEEINRRLQKIKLSENSETTTTTIHTKNRAKTSQFFSTEASVGEIHSACDRLNVSITRATKWVAFVQDTRSCIKEVISTLQKNVLFSVLDENDKKAIDFRFEDWLGRSRKEYSRGNMEQAKNTLDTLYANFRENFSEQQTPTSIMESWAREEREEYAFLEHKKAPLETKTPSPDPSVSLTKNELQQVVNEYKKFEKHPALKAYIELFEKPHFARLLFEPVPPEIGGTLFAQIMENEAKAKLFKEALKSKARFQNNITGESISRVYSLSNEPGNEGKYLGTPLLWLSLNNETLQIFEYLLIKDSFAKSITSDALFSPFMSKITKERFTVLEEFSKNKNSELIRKILLTLFNKNTFLKAYLYSTNIFMAVELYGIQILEERPDLEINFQKTLDEVFSPVPGKSPPTFWDASKYPELLLDACIRNREVIRRLPCEFFIEIFNGNSCNTRNFQWLLTSDSLSKSKEILFFLLEHNHTWVDKIPFYYWSMMFESDDLIKWTSFAPPSLVDVLNPLADKSYPVARLLYEQGLNDFVDVLIENVVDPIKFETHLIQYIRLRFVTYQESMEDIFFRRELNGGACFIKRMLTHDSAREAFITCLLNPQNGTLLGAMDLTRLCEPFEGESFKLCK